MPADIIQCDWREIAAQVRVAVRRNAEKEEPGAASDLEYAPGAAALDARYGGLDPLPHFLRWNRPARVGAVPADDVERGIVLV